jgi:hypothetical protein
MRQFAQTPNPVIRGFLPEFFIFYLVHFPKVAVWIENNTPSFSSEQQLLDKAS